MVDVQNNGDDVLQVVIEPPKPKQMRPKQFVVLKSFDAGKINAKKGTVIRLTQQDAIPYVSARFLLPLDVAIREKIYPTSQPGKEGVVEKVVQKVTGIDIPDADPQADDPKKNFLGNRLREAIQAKKTENSKIDAAKLAAIRAGGPR
jgi:hypothetical protein